MTQQEIQERNVQIALMLGYEISENKECFKLPNKNGWITLEVFYSDWNFLMKAVEFIKENIRTSNNTSDAKVGEYFIDEWEFKVKNYYVCLIQWTENGWRMPDKNDMDLSIRYVIGVNCSSEIEAVFLIVSDFAKLYNNNNNKL